MEFCGSLLDIIKFKEAIILYRKHLSNDKTCLNRLHNIDTVIKIINRRPTVVSNIFSRICKIRLDDKDMLFIVEYLETLSPDVGHKYINDLYISVLNNNYFRYVNDGGDMASNSLRYFVNDLPKLYSWTISVDNNITGKNVQTLLSETGAMALLQNYVTTDIVFYFRNEEEAIISKLRGLPI